MGDSIRDDDGTGNPPRLRPEAIVSHGDGLALDPDRLSEERELYGDVIDAIKLGHLTIDPDGNISATVEGVEAGAPEPPTTIGGRLAALRAAGCDMRRVPDGLRRRARQMLSVLEVVATGEAPADWIDRTEQAAETWIVGRKTGVEPWMLALEAVMSVSAPTESGAAMTPTRPADAARHVIERLLATCHDIPRAFREATPTRLRAAGEALLAARVRRKGKPGGRSALVTPWAVARDFANGFGVPMPEKPSLGARDRKSKRNRNRAR